MFVKNNDLRAGYILGLATTLSQTEFGDPTIVDKYNWLVKAVHEKRPNLIANPELNVAMLAYQYGLLRTFAPLITTFARIGGWTAHIIEKRQ